MEKLKLQVKNMTPKGIFDVSKENTISWLFWSTAVYFPVEGFLNIDLYFESSATLILEQTFSFVTLLP